MLVFLPFFPTPSSVFPTQVPIFDILPGLG